MTRYELSLPRIGAVLMIGAALALVGCDQGAKGTQAEDATTGAAAGAVVEGSGVADTVETVVDHAVDKVEEAAAETMDAAGDAVSETVDDAVDKALEGIVAPTKDDGDH